MQQLCPMCGATIEEQPAGNAVVCPSCGTQVAGGEQEELQLAAALRLVGPPAVALMTLAVLSMVYGGLGVLGYVIEEGSHAKPIT